MSNEDKKLFIFDMGNVTVFNDNRLDEIAKSLGIDCKELESDFDSYSYPLLDGELSTRAYWSHVEHRFNVKVPMDPFYDYFIAEPNDVMIDIIEKLKKAGKRVVCGTNTIYPHFQRLIEKGITKHFHKVYTSMDLGLSKPYPEFYEAILRLEGISADEAFFTDDYPHYVQGAKDVGVSAFHYFGEDKNAKLKEIFAWL